MQQLFLRATIRIFFLPFFLLLTACGPAANSQNITLVNQSRSSYTIIIPTRASAIEDKAAKELQKYMREISGVTLPIQKDNVPVKAEEIAIGRTNRTTGINYAVLEEDGLLIKTSGQKLLLTGGSRKGTLYSVYTFLETYLGCKKYTRDYSIIPKKSTVTLNGPINNQQIPSFQYRTTYFLDAADTEYADWNKLNYAFEGTGSFSHTFQTLLPAATYFNTHPEYFALVDNKRVASQPCLSNPEVFRIMNANLKAAMSQQPTVRSWSVSPNDNLDYCHCSLCEPKHKKENGYMGTLLPFVNKIAKNYPDKTISTLAYHQSMQAPNSIKPENNVEIMLCAIDVNRGKSIPQANDEYAVNFKNALNGWKKLTGNILLWDYIVNYSNSLSPYPNIKSMQPNLQFFKKNQIAKVFELGIGDQKGEFSELKCFLVAKLMWNVNQDGAKVIDEFLTAYYGPAKDEIKSYINLLQFEYDKSKIILYPFGHPIYYENDYLSQQNIDRYHAIFNKAENLVKGNQVYGERIVKERLAVDFVELELANNRMERGVNYAPKAALKTKLNSFVSACNRYGITRLTNGARSPTQFLQSSQIVKP